MTVATISNTITDVVRDEIGHVGGYESAIGKVAEALTEREYGITEAILEAADELGYKHEAEGIIEKVGLSVRPAPAPVEEPVTETVSGDVNADVLKAVKSLAETVGKLVEAAGRHGITLR